MTMALVHEHPADKIVIVYDGVCAFCRRSIAAIQSRDSHGQFIYVPRQTPGLEERYPQVALGDFDTGMRVIKPDGAMHIGADAIYQIASRLPYFRWCAWMYHLPLVHGVTRRVYAWVAANRMKLSQHCGDACLVDAADTRQTDSLPNQRDNLRVWRLVISIFIIFVIGLHIIADLAKTVNASTWIGSRSWPFLSYGMYRHSFAPRVIRTTKHHIVGISAPGHELEVVPSIVGLRPQALHQHFVKPMLRGSSSAARRLADRINVGREDPIIAFRVKTENYAISNSGVVREGQSPVTYPVAR